MIRQERYTDLQGHEYYEQKEKEHIEMVDCMTYAAIWLIIIAGLLSISGNFKELWDEIASCF